MAAVPHGGEYTMGFQDYAAEMQQVSFPIPTLTAGNFAAQAAFITAFKGAVEGVSSAGIALENVVASRSTDDAVTPVTGAASLTQDWLLLVQDASNKKRYVVRIPAPDSETEALRKANSNFADFTHANWIALVSAWGNLVRSLDNNVSAILDARLTSDKTKVTAVGFYKEA